jgi:hypothetical protein
VAGRGRLHDYGGFASADIDGVGRSRAGKGEVSDRTPVCEGRDRDPRTPYGVLALLEGALSGFGFALYCEYALLAVLFGLVASHGAYFGRRLVELAEARKEAEDSGKARMLALRRRRLQRLSFGLSMLNILISAAVLTLATYAWIG